VVSIQNKRIYGLKHFLLLLHSNDIAFLLKRREVLFGNVLERKIGNIKTCEGLYEI